MSRLALASTLLLAAAAACDPYNPSLPDVPYQCGSNEPRCPDGYQPVQVTAVRCECHRGNPSGNDGGSDSGPFVCAMDNREPNNNVTAATPTVVGSGSDSQVFNGVAICPASDVDVYEMMVADPDTGVEVVVDFTEIANEVEVDILNSAGDSIASGTPAGSGRMRAFTTANITGSYFAQVRSGDSTENNYQVRLMITPP